MVGVSDDPLTFWASSQQSTKGDGVGERNLAYQIQPQLHELSKPGCEECEEKGAGKRGDHRQLAAGSGFP